MQIHAGLRRKPRVEMIPLMDIIFLLIVFFIYAMLTMTVGKQGIAVDLPGETTARRSVQDWPVVSIDAGGGFHFAQDAATIDEIKARVARLMEARPQTGVYVNADRASASGRMLDLMNALREAGCNHFEFMTGKTEG